MSVAYLKAMAGAALLLACAGVQAADLSVRVDAREIARRHVHTELTLAVTGGPLTLVFPQWIPGEHGPTGPLDTLIGLLIRANGALLTWRRDPLDMYAINVTVPAGLTPRHRLDTGLPTEGGRIQAGPSSSEQLAVLRGTSSSCCRRVALPQASPPRPQCSPRASGNSAVRSRCIRRATAACSSSPRRWRASSIRRCRWAVMRSTSSCRDRRRFPQLHHTLSTVADSAAALVVPDDFAAGYSRLVAQAGALFGTRMYRHYTWLLALSDHVAHFGLEHHESSDDRTEEDAARQPLRTRGRGGAARARVRAQLERQVPPSGRPAESRTTRSPWTARCCGCTRA